jgi:hypothetical protein
MGRIATPVKVQPATRKDRILLVVYVVALTAACALAFVYGSQILAENDAADMQAIDQETKEVCTLFGVGPGTNKFSECAAVLGGLRARHDQRTERRRF